MHDNYGSNENRRRLHWLIVETMAVAVLGGFSVLYLHETGYGTLFGGLIPCMHLFLSGQNKPPKKWVMVSIALTPIVLLLCHFTPHFYYRNNHPHPVLGVCIDLASLAIYCHAVWIAYYYGKIYREEMDRLTLTLDALRMRLEVLRGSK